MVVIADDITGAAEIAGIAFEAGEDVRLVCGSGTVAGETTVIATDTRSMSETDAAAETRRIASPHFSFLIPHFSFSKRPILLFAATSSQNWRR